MNLVFRSLGEFSRFMTREVAVERIADTAARGEAASYLKAKIYDRFGDVAKLPPPLAASTIARKGSDAPLIETGALRDSIGWAHESVRKTVVGSTDPKAVWHELGPTNGHFPRRSFLASTASEEDVPAFERYATTFFGAVQRGTVTRVS